MNNQQLAIAHQTLLVPYGLTESSIASIFGDIMTHDADYADLYFQYSRSEGWSLEEGRVKSGSFNIDQGVGVRVVSGEKTAFAYSDDITLPAIRDAAIATRSIARIGASGSAGNAAGKVVSATKAKTGHSLYVPNDPVSDFSNNLRVPLIHGLKK